MKSYFVLEKRGYHQNYIDHTKHYTREKATKIVIANYRKGPLGYDLYTMIQMRP